MFTVLSNPHLSSPFRFLILACDGLWDVMDHKTAAEIVHRFYQVRNTN